VARRVVLLVNPAAGRGRGEALAEYAARRLRADGGEVRLLVCRDAADAALAWRGWLSPQAPGPAHPERPDALVAVGGDGWVNIALQAVAGTGVALGVLPAGTGNDLARTLGIPLGRRPAAVAAAVDILRAGLVRRVDAGFVRGAGGPPADAGNHGGGGRWFLSVLSSGFDSRVNERANRMSWPHGRARYVMAVGKELRAFRPVPHQMVLDGEELRTDAMLVAVGNSPCYGGGMRVCPAADLADGLFDVTIIAPISTLTFLRLFPSVFRGEHVRHPAVLTRRARQVTVSAPGMTAYADGELVGPLPVTAEVVPEAVTVLVPPVSLSAV
jgi:diacylglycerol kinase (ATP)